MSPGLQRAFHPHGSLDHIFELVNRTRANGIKSDHDLYHVGTSLLSITEQGKIAIFDSANHIPRILKSPRANLNLPPVTIGTQYGTGTPTVHGEFSVMKKAPSAANTYLACDTPFCPNCMKKAIIRRVNAMFLDSASFDSDSNKERFSKGWHEMSVPFAQAAQMPVYLVDLKNKSIQAIVEGLPPHKRPKNENITILKLDAGTDPVATVQKLLESYLNEDQHTAIAAVHHRQTKKTYIIIAQETIVPGLEPSNFRLLQKAFSGNRYQPEVCPIIQITMEAARRDMTLKGGIVACNYIPSSGRLLDLADCRLRDLLVPEKKLEHAHESVEALKILSRYEAMNIRSQGNSTLDLAAYPGLIL